MSRKDLEETAAEITFLEHFPEITEKEALEIAKKASTKDLIKYIDLMTD